MVDALDLKSSSFRSIGSSPVAGILFVIFAYTLGMSLSGFKVSALEAEDRRFESCHPEFLHSYDLLLFFF